MECKLGYGFGAGACIQWLQVVEILLVCTYSPTHSFLFKRLIVSTIHLFSDFIYQATMLFSPSTFHSPACSAAPFCWASILSISPHHTPLSTSFPSAHSMTPPILLSTHPYANTL